MGHYLFSASYTQAGLKGLLEEGAESRRKAIKAFAKSLGGKVEAMYWSFGGGDVVVIAELPDNAAAASFSTTVGAAGVASVSTTVLLTEVDVDKAIGLKPDYRAPGS